MRTSICILLISLGCMVSKGVYSQEWTSHPDSSIFNFYTAKDISVDQLLEMSKGKRVLVYYYEHYRIDVNNFNAKVLSDTTIVNFIKENFYPIAVNLDIDRMSPSDPYEKRSKAYKDFLKEQTYYIEQTPAFSVYNGAGVLRGSKSFLDADFATRTKFLEYLKKRLK
ncbi:MAG: hypothetical protein HUJ25_09115 [Crocinitomicaceae bacterium]|nr:hypothetical protein [Crocinitomicaceae bacterium]